MVPGSGCADELVGPAPAVLDAIPAQPPGDAGAELVVHRAAAPPLRPARGAGGQAPQLVRAVPAVVHPVTPQVSVNPGPGVTAVENQVSREAVGQMTTELLLLILSIPAVADSVTDPAGRDTGHSVITQEACLVIGGCAEAVHWCPWQQCQCQCQPHGHGGCEDEQCHGREAEASPCAASAGHPAMAAASFSREGLC